MFIPALILQRSRADQAKLLRWAGLVAASWACLCVAPAAAHDGGHLPDITTSSAAEQLRTYEFQDTIRVEGRIDDLLGVAGSSSEGNIGYTDFERRPILREGELLETVPGLITTQHSGDGKSNQMFLRGFNLDHGTDFHTSLEGMPVNMPTHGHGHGYTDANFLVPEFVHHIEYRKGVFHPELGDFGSSGGAEISFFRSIPRPFFHFDVGADRYRRAVGGTSQPIGPGIGLVGLEMKGYDGPWENAQDLKKISGLARYTLEGDLGTLSILGMGYDNQWTSTDQIPQRAVDSGLISRYGAIDPTLGGRSQRYSLSANWRRAKEGRAYAANLYTIQYEAQLFSNFTYRLSDPENGDQIEQVDDRIVVGGGMRHIRTLRALDRDHVLRAGLDTRHDIIDHVGLFAARERERLNTIRSDEVYEANAGAYTELASRWHPRFRSEVSLRGDAFYFDVEDNLLAENSGSETDGIVSPKASVAYLLGDHSELYVSAGLGFHSNDARGTVIQVDPSTGDPATPVNPLVRSKGAEAGLRLVPLEGLRTTISGWVLGIDSELLYVGDGGGTEASDESRRYGVEWTNFYRPLDQLTVELDAAVTHARFLGVDEGLDRIPGALERVVAAGVTWNPTERAFSSMRLRHFASYPLIEDNSVRAEATTLVNANVGYLFGNIRVAAAILNLFDEKASDIQYYYESRLEGEEEAVEDIHFHPVEPRQLRISVGVGR